MNFELLADLDASTSHEIPSTIHDTHRPHSFKYTPLDHQARSIRLIRLCANSSTKDLIRCDLRHALVDDTYVCLSYVWGDTSDGQWIHLNGHPFWVCQNLYDFLKHANQVYHLRTTWLWVDALCIDQNTVAERNHQVQQMGSIYSGAQEVISWLGDDYKIAEFLGNSGLASNNRGKPPPGFREFCVSEYWKRAWITQEIVLARRVTLMAGNAQLLFKLLPSGFGYGTQIEVLMPGMEEDSHAERQHPLKGRSLVSLLENFTFKKCRHDRDRVFSLLALCNDAADMLVDYSLTDMDIAHRVITACRPTLCLCSVSVITRALNLDLQTERSTVDQRTPFAQIILSAVSGTQGQKQATDLTWDVKGRESPNHYGGPFALNLSRICMNADWRLVLDEYLTEGRFFCVLELPRRTCKKGCSKLHARDNHKIAIRIPCCSVRPSRDYRTCTVVLPFLSLLRLAQGAGTSDPTLCGWLRGPRSISILTLCHGEMPQSA